ncbi:hypothetical protein DYB35_001187 [Aphanomyces astaci]|uniref:GOLD domain-containing protein n=1 Tax=Aphanomyces astaci TaxID=112090 RepID=A0A3R6ZWS5_APHAT|nr:hypothetical protein DYB35_001187 [Aphanomyces astaci]
MPPHFAKMAVAAAELSVHVRGIAEKLRKRADDASKKGGAEASAGLLLSVEHLLQSADLMERQHKELLASSAAEPASTTLRNLQLVGAMLEKKSEEMRSKQAVGPANSLAQSASHVRTGLQRLEAVHTWLASTLGDAYSPDMDWTDALSQVSTNDRTSHGDESALKAVEANVASLEAELAQWKHHHEATQAQQMQLLEQLERAESDLSAALKSQRDIAATNEAIRVDLASERERNERLEAHVAALKSENAKAEQEMQDEWERVVKQNQVLTATVKEFKANVAGRQECVDVLQKEGQEVRDQLRETELELEAKTVQVEQLAVQLDAVREKLTTAEQTIATFHDQGATITASEEEAAASTIHRLEGELAAATSRHQAALDSHQTEWTAAEAQHLATIRSLQDELETVRGLLSTSTDANTVERLNGELEDLRQQLATASSDLDGSKAAQQIELLERELEVLQDQVRTLEATSDDAKNVIEALEVQLSSVRDQWTAAELAVETLTSQLVAAKALAETRQDTIDALEDELVVVRRQATEAVETAGSWEDELVAVRDGISRLEAQLAMPPPDIIDELADRGSTGGGGVESVSSVGDKLAQLARAIHLLHEEKGLFQSEIERLQATVADEQATVNLHHEQVRALEVHVDKTHQMHQEMRTTHEEASMAMQEHAAKLKDELGVLRAENARWADRTQALELEVLQLTQAMADLSNAVPNELGTDTETNLVELTNQIHALELFKQELLEKLATATATATALETEVEQSKQNVAELHKNVVELTGEKTQVVEQLNAHKLAMEAFDVEKFELHAQHKGMEDQYVKSVQDLQNQVAAKDAELLALQEQSQTLLAQEQSKAAESMALQTAEVEVAKEALISAEGMLRELQATHSSMVNDFQQRQAQLEQLHSQEIATYSNQSDELASRVSELETQLAGLKEADESQTAQWESQVAWLEQQLAAVRDELAQAQQAKAELLGKQCDLEVQTAEKIQSFVDKINDVVAEKATLQASASASDQQWQRQIDALELQVHTLTDETQRLADDHRRHVVQLQHETKDKAEDNVCVTEDKACATECELDDAKAKTEDLTNRIKHLEDEIERHLKVQEGHADALVDLTARLNAAHDVAVRELESEWTNQHAAKIQRLMEKVNALTGDKHHLQTEHEVLTGQLAALGSDKARLTQDITQLRTTLDEKAAQVQTLAGQVEDVRADKAEALADVATWQGKVDALQETHKAEVAKWKQTIEALEAREAAHASSGNEQQATIGQERDQALVRLNQVQSAFEEYKARAAAALKKAEKRTALLNPMLAEKQLLESQVATLQDAAHHAQEKLENQLLAKEETISPAIEDAAAKVQEKSAYQEELQAKQTLEWQAHLTHIQAMEASVVEKEGLLAASASKLDQFQLELTALHETVELKAKLVAKVQLELESVEAAKELLQTQLDDAHKRLESLLGEPSQLEQLGRTLEATTAELEAQRHTSAELEQTLGHLTNEMKTAAEASANQLAAVKAELAELAASKRELEAKVVSDKSSDASNVDAQVAALQSRIGQLEADKAALDESWRVKMADGERLQHDLVVQITAEKAALAASLEAANTELKRSDTGDDQVRELQRLVQQKDAAVAELSRRLEVEQANEKMAFEATKLLKSQLDEKDSYVQLVKQNAELQLRQAGLDADRKLAEQRRAQLVEHEEAIAAMKASLLPPNSVSNVPTATHDENGTTTNNLRVREVDFQAKVDALTEDNESLRRQLSTAVANNYPEQLQKLQQDNADLVQSMHSLRETLNEKLQQLATLKAPAHTKMLDELERTIDHEKRALFERKERHGHHMSKLRRDADTWLDEAQRKLDQHAALHEMLPKEDVVMMMEAQDVVVNPLEVTLVLKSGVSIKAGSSFELPVVVSAGQTIQWSFRIEELETDVNFALTFNGDVDVVPVDRVERLEGTYQAKADGVLQFAWDNAFSWLNPKTLDYHVSVFEPLTEAALQTRKAQEIVKGQLKMWSDKLDVMMVVCPKLSQVQDKMHALKTLIGLYVQEQQELTEATASLTMLLEEIHQEQRDLHNTCHLHKLRDETTESVQAKLRALEAQLEA